MPRVLFSTGKVGCVVEGYGPKKEKRRGEDVTCVSVRLRVWPFDAKLAQSLDNGAGGDSNIRATVFSVQTTELKKHFTRHDFKLSELPPQNLLLFASPDTDEARVVLDQAKISGCYVKTENDGTSAALCFKATFGPVGRDQLELVHSLYKLQTFVTFEEGEPLLDMEDDDGDDEDDDDTGGPALLDAARGPHPAEPVNRPLHSHQSKAKRRATPPKRGRR